MQSPDVSMSCSDSKEHSATTNTDVEASSSSVDRERAVSTPRQGTIDIYGQALPAGNEVSTQQNESTSNQTAAREDENAVIDKIEEHLWEAERLLKGRDSFYAAQYLERFRTRLNYMYISLFILGSSSRRVNMDRQKLNWRSEPYDNLTEHELLESLPLPGATGPHERKAMHSFVPSRDLRRHGESHWRCKAGYTRAYRARYPIEIEAPMVRMIEEDKMPRRVVAEHFFGDEIDIKEATRTLGFRYIAFLQFRESLNDAIGDQFLSDSLKDFYRDQNLYHDILISVSRQQVVHSDRLDRIALPSRRRTLPNHEIPAGYSDLRGRQRTTQAYIPWVMNSQQHMNQLSAENPDDPVGSWGPQNNFEAEIAPGPEDSASETVEMHTSRSHQHLSPVHPRPFFGVENNVSHINEQAPRPRLPSLASLMGRPVDWEHADW